jgi:2-polyprenyl-3-methyl-5-hydroxy-6-metoxy-1,4-benzoquinol methylase
MSNNTLLRRIYQLLTIPIQEKWVGTLQAGAVVRSLYLTWVLRELISTNASYNILDAGSGRGAPLTLVQAGRFKNCHFVAVDLNQDYPARQHFGIPENVRFVKSDITNYTTNVLFDIVICLDVLEHIENYEQVIIRFSKCLRPSGKLIVHVPSINQFTYFTDDHEDYHRHNINQPGMCHVREGFNINELQSKIEEYGFECIHSRYTFGHYTWLLKEIYSKFEKKRIPGIGIMILPSIWFGARLESLVNIKKGNGILILARKL